jgi:predicted unusual protein kinase regulating ubiquinone biosynthesis (AarF/ABC1/UbiB family)
MPELPTGRIRRAVPVAGAVARSALGRAIPRRKDEDRELERYTREAERYAELLGGMKGALMKAGQLLSFVDSSSLVPPQYADAFKTAMASLQADAPPMDAEAVAAVIAEELGARPEQIFTRFSPLPIAAASIGQVHAAELADGTELAVKVQYPGVAEAVRSDLANVELIASFMKMGMRLLPGAFPNLDARVVAEEIRDRVGEELDYLVEAAHQQAFADAYEGHPFIHIPAVVHELTTARVLTQTFVDGRRWAAALDSEQELKDQWGEVISRFVYGGLYRTGLFNGDPHPGNYLFHEDGSVTFLDFGCVQRFTPETLAQMNRLGDVVVAGDAPGLKAVLAEMGFFPAGDKVDADRLFEWYRPAWEALAVDGRWTYTPEWAAALVERTFDPLGPWSDVSRRFAIPKDMVFMNRIQLGLNSVLGALRATADWKAIDHETRHGAPPATELGRREAEWRASRPDGASRCDTASPGEAV